MKGIILAGGSGTRLDPLTIAASKQVLPIYDKPMIYYPLSTLLLAGIREVLIISTPRDLSLFKDLLGNGSQLGVSIAYAVQESPNGLAEAFIIGEKFIEKDNVCLVLGDNFFYGAHLQEILVRSRSYLETNHGALVFGYPVKNPSDFGIVDFDTTGRVVSLEEKPEQPKSSIAVPGLYFYDNEVIDFAKSIKPSSRGELEITSINRIYLAQNKLHVTVLPRGAVWLDTGTHENLLEAAEFVSIVQRRQGVMISCIEEIAYRKGFIDIEQLEKLSKPLMKTQYGKYIQRIVDIEKDNTHDAF